MSQKYLPASRKALIAKHNSPDTEFGPVTLYSTACLKFRVVDPDAANGVAYAVLDAGQELTWLGYGLAGGTVTLGGQELKATLAETNLQKPGETNGASDVSVEAVSLHTCAPLIRYGTDLAPSIGTDWGTKPADPVVIRALTADGGVSLIDFGSVVSPPQIGSVFNLGQQLLQALSLVSIEIERDGATTDRIGTADLIPGSGPTYAMTNGAPEVGNVKPLGDGLIWANTGGRDSEILVKGRVMRSTVVPIQYRTFPGGSAKQCPCSVYLPLKLALHGVEFHQPRPRV